MNLVVDIPTVRPVAPVRKLRGGGQAHLLTADDGRYYAVKFSNNPQGSRILTNEVLGHIVLRSVGIRTPNIALIEVEREWLDHNPEVYIQHGYCRVAPRPGIHFGSEFPDPNKIATFESLPVLLLGRVSNLADFSGALVVDKWLSNSDGRQAVFCLDSESKKMEVSMIDQGYILDGRFWQFLENPDGQVHYRSEVYDGITSLTSFWPWLERVLKFPVEELYGHLVNIIPEQWFERENELELLEDLCEELGRRRSEVPGMLRESRSSRNNVFRNWIK